MRLTSPGYALEPPPTTCLVLNTSCLHSDACKINLSVTERFLSQEGDYEMFANSRNCVKLFPKNISS